MGIRRVKGIAKDKFEGAPDFTHLEISCHPNWPSLLQMDLDPLDRFSKHRNETSSY